MRNERLVKSEIEAKFKERNHRAMREERMESTLIYFRERVGRETQRRVLMKVSRSSELLECR